MSDPRVMAIICGFVAVYNIYSLATATEAPSTALYVLQLAFIAGALLGLIGAIIKMSKGDATGN